MEFLNSDSPVFSRSQVRDFDRYAMEELKIPGVILMENAGRVLTETLLTTISGNSLASRVLILAGPGNNGGDGFVMARHLQRLSFRVEVIAIGKKDSWKGDAAVNLTILEHLTDETLKVVYFDKDSLNDSLERLSQSLAQADVVVDAILGTGAHGEPRFPISKIIQSLNSAMKTVFAVDIPSGLDSDTGEAASQTVRANVTCTLAAFKKGFVCPAATEYTGKIILGDIGVAISKLLGSCR